MITKSKIIDNINDIRNNTPVTFKNFGGFVLRLMMLSVEDQEFVVDSLMKAAEQRPTVHNVIICSVDRMKVNLKNVEKDFRFILVHEFRCKFCKQIHKEAINVKCKKFRDICEFCLDKTSEDYDR